MSAKRTERLLTLVVLLLSERRGWTKEELFREVELYEQAPTPAAREKLFDRDKATLREQGIPVESFTEDPLFDNDNTTVRYRINAEDYRLPAMSFTAAESAALTIAAGMWEEASLGSAAARALRKLQGRAIVEDGTSAPSSIDARIRTNEPFWDKLWQATTARRMVRFTYRAASTGEERRRTVQPWGMGSRFGHWYLVGFDVDRQAARWFRLSRITSAPTTVSGSYTVPAGFSMAASLASLPSATSQLRARVNIRKGTCQVLRTRPGAFLKERPEGWDSVEYTYADEPAAAGEIASFGANAVVESPATLVSEVRQRLEGAVRAVRAPTPSFSFGEPARAESGRGSTSTEDRLLRLLDLVPYLLNHPGVEVEVAARDFGISPAQLIKDVELLFVSGPRYYPDGLIDIHLEDGRIQVGDPQALGDPIRFGLDEVSALLVGLDALSSLPGLPDDSAVRSAREKLRSAAGDAAAIPDSFATQLAEHELSPLLTTVRAGVEQRRQLHLRYVVPARDEVTERFVDPLRAFHHDGSWYLEAWCHDAGGRRNFRLDRVRDLMLTERPATMEPGAEESRGPLFDPTGADRTVTLLLQPGAQWIAQSYAAERTAQIPDGRLAAEIRVASAAWVPGLVASLGGAVTVAFPEDTRRATMAFVADALSNYPSSSGN